MLTKILKKGATNVLDHSKKDKESKKIDKKRTFNERSSGSYSAGDS